LFHLGRAELPLLEWRRGGIGHEAGQANESAAYEK
jgi:hypothetical protein